MRRLLLLATTLLALNSPANANGWVRNPANHFAAREAGLWVIEDLTHSLGGLLGIQLKVPLAMSEGFSNEEYWAFIGTSCFFSGSPLTSLIVVSFGA